MKNLKDWAVMFLAFCISCLIQPWVTPRPFDFFLNLESLSLYFLLSGLIYVAWHLQDRYLRNRVASGLIPFFMTYALVVWGRVDSLLHINFFMMFSGASRFVIFAAVVVLTVWGFLRPFHGRKIGSEIVSNQADA